MYSLSPMPKRTKGRGERGEILDLNGDLVRTRKDMVMLARELRATMTREEELLWERLRGKKLRGIRFYRQVPIDRYVADFYCPRYKLIIELDGSVHEQQEQREHDHLRNTYLQKRGFRILRIQNKKVMQNLHGVVCDILDACTETKTPPPREA